MSTWRRLPARMRAVIWTLTGLWAAGTIFGYAWMAAGYDSWLMIGWLGCWALFFSVFIYGLSLLARRWPL